MSLREQCYNVIDHMNETQLKQCVLFLKDLQHLDEYDLEEVLDDAFCIALAERHGQRSDKDDPGIPIEDLAEELGIVLGEDDEN